MSQFSFRVFSEQSIHQRLRVTHTIPTSKLQWPETIASLVSPPAPPTAVPSVSILHLLSSPSTIIIIVIIPYASIYLFFFQCDFNSFFRVFFFLVGLLQIFNIFCLFDFFLFICVIVLQQRCDFMYVKQDNFFLAIMLSLVM